MRTPVKNFPIYVQGFFASPKTAKIRYYRDRAAAQMAKCTAMGIISGASRHPKDLPFVREFLWGRTVWAL